MGTTANNPLPPAPGTPVLQTHLAVCNTKTFCALFSPRGLFTLLLDHWEEFYLFKIQLQRCLP